MEKTVNAMMDLMKNSQQRDPPSGDVKVKAEDDDCVVSVVANRCMSLSCTLRYSHCNYSNNQYIFN